MARNFRNHGITSDHLQRSREMSWDYDMASLGFNYRLADMQSALGLSQLKKLPQWLARRAEIAAWYDGEIYDLDGVQSLKTRENVRHANHLYVIRIDSRVTGVSRDEMFVRLRQKGIGVNVHYKPVFEHSYYKKRFPGAGDECVNANEAANEILSLPIFPIMTDSEVNIVMSQLKASLVSG